MNLGNPIVSPLMTDLYEFTMAYAYFKSGKHEDHAVFELFFRNTPFGGEFAVFAGLSEVVGFLERFRFTVEQRDAVVKNIPGCSSDFGDWLLGTDCSSIRVNALSEGTLAFPRVPLLRVEGPLAICQLLESALLNLVSYPTLVATNAARMKLAAGVGKRLVEFGLRRAQGPDGALSASRYSYLGGFEGTSNVLASHLFDIPVSGTQAHSFISSFTGLDTVEDHIVHGSDGQTFALLNRALHHRTALGFKRTSDAELAAFIAYARAFPNGFLALVDTYDTLQSGIPNFLAIALALIEAGYKPVGIRLDSGDLAHLSKAARRMFSAAADTSGFDLTGLVIVASNEINEHTLHSLNAQGHEVDIFGVGTHLVTCQSQPSLGCVYKLAEINNQPRIKISQESAKTTIPGQKNVYRLIGENGHPLVDLMLGKDEPAPNVGTRILCCHPFEESKRTYVVPAEVVPLHSRVWDGKAPDHVPSLQEAREHARTQLASMRTDHLRPLNPTPYKVSLSEQLFKFMRELWNREAPVRELR